ncbi:hypothetical protein NFI99_12660 (plasmid) [Burkholderia glumae]|uniref:Uncharacterized protein n=1 Tax=Burkholderia glumae TaxID=337 RepID=A0ABY5BB30_BURGL|nr:hypothetical protein [Burkholderia glumae]USS44137.1 hypothetical protein NFI99_12660 [Burkholderia glumae]
MKAVIDAERLPRWKDCLAFAVVALTLLLVVLLSKGPDAAMTVGVRVGAVMALLLVVTAVRQRRAR